MYSTQRNIAGSVVEFRADESKIGQRPGQNIQDIRLESHVLAHVRAHVDKGHVSGSIRAGVVWKSDSDPKAEATICFADIEWQVMSG